ncbi:RNA polymerase sigma factor [Runella slithyformis]|uniref:RNA polymerase, sigma-24 subunit, ECF subfamily n=1 Tax=Runella slithyformis (strain ATCC 29530 / DSM 19594 / LMG 11500 / NCIMB 11436 / LSU 4) TaxID=761193 RepID=A0A7U3ZNV5_RUNSL|nr:sigma-70 family RNA polymerase sigma factor [Runella slithyformis]AEI50650.1 RNA polymerase, sigma-24 subunit, ECF subfamily [Runella slithyformis DSM 19594]
MQEAEFLEILRANQGVLVKVCTMYCADAETRRDLYQEIILQLWRSFPTYRKEAKISTWLYQVALNTAITDFRRSRKQGVRLELSEQLGQIPDTSSAVEWQENVQWLYRAVDTLSDAEKAIVMLYLEEKSYDEIAEIVGITTGNVRVRMHRIQEKLRKLKTD